ncbi:HutD family protein [Streptomyces axinellae]|uniref:Uncharacterized protein n=1 Tax=Streptomyces axinellae TaxID=552788 RepID=A0ABP6CHG6_9ACTN
MILDLDGTEHRLTPLTPFAFSGDSTVSCRLPAGPTRDVNVMTRQGRAKASVRVVEVSDHPPLAAYPGETLLALPLSGALTLCEPEETALERLDTVRQDGPGHIRLRGHGTLIEIRIALNS